MAPSQINTEKMPGDNMSPSAIEAAASSINTVGTKVSAEGATVLTTWQKISAYYHAPEQATLFHAMNPVKTDAEKFGTDVGTVSTALKTFAEEVRTIKAAVVVIRADAASFAASIANGVEQDTPQVKGETMKITVDWHKDADSVAANNALIARTDRQQEALWAAERACANAIYDVIGHAHVEAGSETNPNGYGVDHIPDNAGMPWGDKVEKTENCSEGISKGLEHGAGAMASGVGALLGVSYSSKDGWDFFSGSTAGNAWKGVGMFAVGVATLGPGGLALGAIPGPVGTFFRDSQKLVPTAVAGLVAIDLNAKDPLHKWKEKGWEALGESIFNVGTLFVAPTKAGNLGKLGRVGEVAAKAGDPVYLALQASKALKSLGGLTVEGLAKLRGATHFGDALDFHPPEIPSIGREHVSTDVPNTGHTPADATPARDHSGSDASRDTTPDQPADHQGNAHQNADHQNADHQATDQHASADHAADHSSDGTPADPHGSDASAHEPSAAASDHDASADHAENQGDATPAHAAGDDLAAKGSPERHVISDANHADYQSAVADRKQLAVDHTAALRERNALAEELGVSRKDLSVKNIDGTLEDLRDTAAGPEDRSRINRLEQLTDREYKSARELNAASENLGMSASRDVIAADHGTVVVGADQLPGRSHELDLVGVSDDGSTMTVVEAKGGDSARLGTRMVDGMKTQQGSTTYLGDLLHRDVRLQEYLHNNPEFRDRLASGEVKVEYKLVNARTNGRVRVIDLMVDPDKLRLGDFGRTLVRPGVRVLAMSEWSAVPKAELRDLAEWLASWPWPLEESAVLDLVAARGWKVMSHDAGNAIEWETGLVGRRPWAHVTLIDGVVSRASVTMSEVLPEKSAESTAFLRDVFADHVATLSELLGPPAERKPGAKAFVRWLLPNGAALRVGLGLSCTWSLRSPEFVQIEADLGRR